eukprot:gb/GECG01008952.1/.p1 GENE.gb/GECG01008952.1/~~gb/GECG01008952.1/.p1  ORF type:complete len:496 (+),score=62.28 gb/GECG01008952.1/:1-1488(+)
MIEWYQFCGISIALIRFHFGYSCIQNSPDDFNNNSFPHPTLVVSLSLELIPRGKNSFRPLAVAIRIFGTIHHIMRTVQSLLCAVLMLAVATHVQGASWKVVSRDMANTLFAIAFTNSTTGFVPVGADGAGAEVLKSTDSGRTWKSEAGVVGLDLMAAEAEGNSVVASGMFSIVWSGDSGKSFEEAGVDKSLAGMQDVTAADSQYFGIPGSGLEDGNGILVSSNGGRNFTFYPAAALNTRARYAAMPSRSCWYISAGEWPEAQGRDLKSAVPVSEQKRVHALGYDISHPMVTLTALSRRIALVEDKRTYVAGQPLKGRKTLVVLSHSAETDDSTDDEGQWIAQIAKTTDGGKTFQSVFEEYGKFYFNMIDCYDENHCCAVGESDAGPLPGNRVYCTNDGGSNWKRTMFYEDASLSIMGIKFVGPSGQKTKEAWAAGGLLERSGFTGYFWHSLDGGYTWTNETLNGTYATDISFPSSTSGFASLLTLESGPAVAAYD